MNTMKLTLVLFVALILFAAIPVFAFHNGSQLVCDNCHTMHYSEGGYTPSTTEGYPQNASSGGPFDYLLVKSNISDLCLQCHMNNQYTGAPSVLNTTPGSGTLLPGGDFGYTYNVAANALPGQVPGGHNPFGNSAFPSANINPSPDGGATGLVPPGNTGAALTNFVCTNCHGVHGPESGNVSTSHPLSYQNYGYRLLLAYTNGTSTLVSTDSILSQAWILSNDTVVPGPDGANLTVSESSTNHNVYMGGFSEWCSGCHGNFHSESNTDPNVWDATNSAFVRHPTNYALTSGVIKDYGSNYNYVYPLNVATNSDGQTPTNENPISTNDKIMCLTCHQAHASANPNALRWNPTQASALGQCNVCHQVGGGV